MTDRGTSNALATTTTTDSAPELSGRAAPWLRPWIPGPTRSLIPFDRRSGCHAYYRLAGTSLVVALEGPAGLRLPIAINLTRAAFDRATAARQAKLGLNCLWIDGHPVTVSCADDEPPRFAADGATASRARKLLDAIMATAPAPEALPAVRRAIARFAAALETGDGVVRAATGLVGLGPGSTPVGDDVLAGAVATLTAISPEANEAGRIDSMLTDLRVAIADCLDRTTPLSAGLLEAAVAGHMIPRLARCLERLLRGMPAGPAVRSLCSVGHSSGYFLAVGADLGLAVAARARSGPDVVIAG